MSIYIFGYGSLIGACGVNGRGMRKQYKPKDLTETYLRGYTRHLKAGAGYYGISPDPNGVVNGVVFKIKQKDIRPFLASEGFNFREEYRPYVMVDVTRQVDLKVKGKIWACVCTRENDVSVMPGYFRRVGEALNDRSKKFRKEFGPFDWDYKSKEVINHSTYGLPWDIWD